MADIVEQLCIKSYEVTDVDGNHWKAEQGKTYTTTVPTADRAKVMVFSNYWVGVPKEHFVISEDCPFTRMRAKEMVCSINVTAGNRRSKHEH